MTPNKRALHPSIVILTGAGISAESGLGTFRDVGGLWTRYNLEDVATPEGFARDPQLVLAFYSARRENLAGARPNPAHLAIARLEREWAGEVLVVTQNVDDLHEQAGSTRLLHMHGELAKTRCMACGDVCTDRAAIDPGRACAACGHTGELRPDVVWFGEMPYHMDEIEVALSDCALFAAIGTSGSVYPAAGFVRAARAAGARTVELNLEPSEVRSAFHEGRYGPASEVVPAWVEDLLSGRTG
ncbi:NAD-dependent deacylase [Futiania mangrovi]|uniref:NAD-dependent protein deacylase n=1 Tax=Futiania mangrovi TaxID=2959716 RepID=A0A9J6PFL4_9PROT|nr:NAD-dependent deacylase [Futiania mangrovii]MCP1336616.1 NAD-dependent deacylase [Futiania mangrovii]